MEKFTAQIWKRIWAHHRQLCTVERVYKFVIRCGKGDSLEKHKFRVSLTMSGPDLILNWATTMNDYDDYEFKATCSKNDASHSVCMSNDYWVIELHEIACGAYSFKLLYSPTTFGWKLLHVYVPQGLRDDFFKGKLKVSYSLPKCIVGTRKDDTDTD